MRSGQEGRLTSWIRKHQASLQLNERLRKHRLVKRLSKRTWAVHSIPADIPRKAPCESRKGEMKRTRGREKKRTNGGDEKGLGARSDVGDQVRGDIYRVARGPQEESELAAQHIIDRARKESLGRRAKS